MIDAQAKKPKSATCGRHASIVFSSVVWKSVELASKLAVLVSSASFSAAPS